MQMMKTYLPKVNVDERKWHVIDADGAVLGRLAVQVADVLRGKNKPYFFRSRIRGSRVSKPSVLRAGRKVKSALSSARAIP